MCEDFDICLVFFDSCVFSFVFIVLLLGCIVFNWVLLYEKLWCGLLEVNIKLGFLGLDNLLRLVICLLRKFKLIIFLDLWEECFFDKVKRVRVVSLEILIEFFFFSLWSFLLLWLCIDFCWFFVFFGLLFLVLIMFFLKVLLWVLGIILIFVDVLFLCFNFINKNVLIN